jgi:hypothetical protein
MMARTGGARRTSQPTTAGGTAATPSRPGRPCSVSGGADSARSARSLTLFQRFHVETRVHGWDEKSFAIEQRFIRGDDVGAMALVVGRFLGPDGSVPPADVVALGGLDPASLPLPVWAARLAAAQQDMPA